MVTVTGPLLMSLIGMSTIITTHTSSWLTIWVLMEINMATMTLLLASEWNKEKTIMFFIVQSLPSIAVLLSISISWAPFQEVNNPSLMSIVVVSMACKMGMFPAHMWALKLSKEISWQNNLMLMTWQKVIPIIIMVKISFSKMITGLALASVTVMTLALVNSTAMKSLLMASSMVHMSWICMAMGKLKLICLMYLSVYSILALLVTKQFKKYKTLFMMSQEASKSNDQMSTKVNIISMSGIPPFTGFFLKAMVVYSLVKYNTPNKAGLFLLIMATGAFYAYSQIVLKMMSLKPKKKKESKASAPTNEKKSILWNLVLPSMVMMQ